MAKLKQGRNEQVSKFIEDAKKKDVSKKVAKSVQKPETSLDDTVISEIAEGSQDSQIEVVSEWRPPDSTAVINTERPDENHPTRGWKPPDKDFRWCTELQRNKTGMKQWMPVRRSEHPELVPIDHPLTTTNDGAQDQIRINDAFLCEAPKSENKKRRRYYLEMDERRVNRKLYESHRDAQRESGGPGILFKTARAETGEIGSSTIRQRKPMVSVPAQIK